MAVKWILIHGNPIDGLRFTGLFDSADEAVNHGDTDDADWWISHIEVL